MKNHTNNVRAWANRLLIAFLSWMTLSSAFASNPPTPPEGWHIFASAQGDLNGDKRSDLAWILQKEVKKPDSETLIRRLVVYFAGENGFRKALQTQDELLSFQPAMCETDPLGEVETPLSIQKGYLWLIFSRFWSCGIWWMGSETYQIRYKNSQFQLIGSKSEMLHRASQDQRLISTNYLTGKQKIQEGNLEGASKPPEWHTLPSQVSQQLDLSQMQEFP